MKKLEDVVIYRDEDCYSAFPSIVSCPDGELLVAFRRAPDRRRLGGSGCTHTDPNSYLVMVRSRDLGRTWSEAPELICAHPRGGSQDPCMVRLDDGTLLVASYLWIQITNAAAEQADLSHNIFESWRFIFGGGYLMRSTDVGRTWAGPIAPPELDDQLRWMAHVPVPAFNRGAMVQANDGGLYWAVARTPKGGPGRTVLDLLISRDRGLTWAHGGPIAADDAVVFNETSLMQTAGGDLVGFVRTANFEDHGVLIRSRDMGETWEPWQDTGIVGHPHHALRLPDDRVYLVYGYRHEPYGIRARVLDPECTQFDSDEIVLRDDGGTRDLGYPWSCLTADGRVLSVYYINEADDARYIGGTFLEIE